MTRNPQTCKPKSRRHPPARKPRTRKPPALSQSAQQPPTSLSLASQPTRSRASAATGQAPGAAADTRSAPDRRVRIGSPIALLAAVPLLLEFEPSNSFVVVGAESRYAEVRLTLRYNLPDPADPALTADLAAHAVGVLAAQHVNRALAVGYGPGHLVTPLADALRMLAPRAGIAVTDVLRVENGRYWSYVCGDPDCCPPDGTPFNLSEHPVARALAGAARVLSSRAELAATVAPVDGDAAKAMQRATRRAESQVARLVARVARSGARASARRLIATAGVTTVAEVIERYRQGQSASPEVAAWVTVVLRDLRVRDDAWSRMLPEYTKEHLRLWTDLTRMARPGYVSAPAALLAFVAWQTGNGALANVALDRALSDDPGYSMAVLLRQAIESGAPPSLARLPMSPEEVAASYDEMEAADDDYDGGAGYDDDSGYDDFDGDGDGRYEEDDDRYDEDNQDGVGAADDDSREDDSKAADADVVSDHDAEPGR